MWHYINLSPLNNSVPDLNQHLLWLRTNRSTYLELTEYMNAMVKVPQLSAHPGLLTPLLGCPVSLPVICYFSALVGRVGLEPTMPFGRRIYSPLRYHSAHRPIKSPKHYFGLGLLLQLGRWDVKPFLILSDGKLLTLFYASVFLRLHLTDNKKNISTFLGTFSTTSG